MKKHVALIGILGGLAVSLLFNNCTAEHNGDFASEEGFSVVGETNFVPCAFKDDMDLFGKTFAPFLRTNCSSCHVEGGLGKGAFASSGALVAFNSFDLVGYEKVSQYAVNDSHKPPYSGSQHNGRVSLLQDQWIKGLENIAECKASGGGGVSIPVIDPEKRLDTKSLPLNLNDVTVETTVQWTLEKDLLDKNGTITLPNAGNAIFSLTIRRATVNGKPMYEFTQPTLKAVGTDLIIQSLLVKINGRMINGQTTFRYVDEGVRASDPEPTLLGPGVMLVDGVITPYDLVSVSIGILQPTVLPPRPIPPVISFAQSTLAVPETISTPSGKPWNSDLNFIELKLTLDKPSTEFITASIGAVTTGYSASQLAVNRTSTEEVNLPFDNGRDLIIDRWDWDYKIDNSAVVFEPGVTLATIRVQIANDQRDEVNELLPLEIRSLVGATRSPTNGKVLITINDDDDAPNPEIPTFSSLMKRGASDGGGGVLYDFCYRCHNSFDNRGGYNLSNYDLMINNGVLVPYEKTSMMFRRMNEEIPGLRTMPLEGLLPTDKRRLVELWILNGAKND